MMEKSRSARAATSTGHRAAQLSRENDVPCGTPHGNCGDADVREISGIIAGLKRLDSGLDQLNEAIQALDKMLDPILNSSGPCAGAQTKEVQTSGIAKDIGSLSEKITAAIYHVESITNRVDL